MKRYDVYAPETFGFHGMPNDDESFAVFVEVDAEGRETGEGMLAYVVNEEYMVPPYVDLDTAEPFVVEEDMTEGFEPVFSGMELSDMGSIKLQAMPKIFSMTAEQTRLLAEPNVIDTAKGRYWMENMDASETMFKKDESLEAMRPVSLNMRKFNFAVQERYPALLEHTHSWYGHKYPNFPNAKFFENKDKMVVFIAQSQLKDVSPGVLNASTPIFRDWMTEEDWSLRNIYGVCIVDDTTNHYTVKLVSPKAFIRECEQAKSPVQKEEAR